MAFHHFKTSILNFLWEFIIELVFCAVSLCYCYAKYTDYRRIPGPMFSFPCLGHWPFLRKKPHLQMMKMKEKYGDIIGLKLGSYNTVFLNEYKIAKTILENPVALDRTHDLLRNLPLGFGVANGTEWNEQRSFCVHTMMSLAKGPWETLNKESSRSFVEQLCSLGGQPCDVTDLAETALSNNIISLLLGRRLNPITDKKDLDSIKNFKNVLRYYGPTVAGSLVPGFRKFCERFHLLGYHQARDTVSNFYGLIKKELELRRSQANYGNPGDFLNLYDAKLRAMDSEEDPHFYSDASLLGNVTVLYLGGSDTVTASLTWLFRFMAKYPDIQKKVHDELDKVLPPNNVIGYEDKGKVPYTWAVMQESQRISTIVPLACIRRTSEDLKVGKYTFKKDTLIIANMWAIHRDSRQWTDAEVFNPERFFGRSASGNAAKLLTFSTGRRKCPGENIAWTVLLPFFTAVMRKFTISVPLGAEVNFDVTDGLVSHLKGQELCFTERH